MQEQKVSPYTILNKWLYDGNRESKVPNEILVGGAIGPQYLLYFFKGSKYLVYINKIFNNFYIYQLNKEEIFTMLKDIVIRTGYRPKFYKTASRTKIKLIESLRKKLPTLKIAEINILANKIENSDYRDSVFETLGLEKGINKKRTTKQQLEQIKQDNTQKDYSDCVMEVDAAEAIKEIGDVDSDLPFLFSTLLQNFTIEGIRR